VGDDLSTLKVAVVGQGSIGRRHATILQRLGHEPVVFDPVSAKRQPDAAAASSLRECLQGADAAVVASPSSEHVGDARTAIELGVPVLVEKPLALDAAGAAELDCLARERGVMLSVAMNLREHEGVRSLARLLAADAVGRILRASVWCGSWLPDWRPGSDYRASYSAQARLGGGVLLDVAVHELDYMLWLAGPARAVTALARRVSDLELDVEDLALMAVELDSGAMLEVAVDYFDRSYTRGCRVVGSHGTLHWNWEEQRLTRHDASGVSSRSDVPSDVAPTYVRQLERFLLAVKDGASPPVSAAEARHVLAVLDGARVSSRTGRRVALAPAVTMREVTGADAELLRSWRNDPESRRWSRTSHEISPAEHEAWLARALGDASTRLWMAETGEGPVGHVRVGPSAGGVAEVHVVVAPHARGRGLGATVLVEAVARALAGHGTDLLIAYVKPGHEASLRAFARAGFREAGSDEEGLLRLERSPAGG
jgi:predicted dehydrogenase/L-amino acid N-acyltransferase YncA